MNPQEQLRDSVQKSGIRTIKVVSWRDLDDPEAGGSEIHADQILSRWAAAGLDVVSRTSAVPGRATKVERNGYRVERFGGRYSVFPDVVRRGFLRDARKYDAVVEIWNGMPFFSPLWFHRKRLILLHHVHGEMWQLTLPGTLGSLGWTLEHQVAPLVYRRSQIATLSTSSAEEIHERLGLKHVAIVPPGISEFFSVGGRRDDSPLVVAVGRLVTVKRFDALIDHFAQVRQHVPNARLVIAGEGYLRTELEAQVESLGARDWIELPGRVSDEDLRDLYRRAWLVTSASLREGWGMSLTEAAACGTPSVAVDIAGHRDAVAQGRSGLLVADDELANGIVELLVDSDRLESFRRGALEWAAELSWDNSALRLFELLQSSR